MNLRLSAFLFLSFVAVTEAHGATCSARLRAAAEDIDGRRLEAAEESLLGIVLEFRNAQGGEECAFNAYRGLVETCRTYSKSALRLACTRRMLTAVGDLLDREAWDLLSELADSLRSSGDPTGAIDIWNRMSAIARAIIQPMRDMMLTHSLERIASTYLESGESRKAVETYRELFVLTIDRDPYLHCLELLDFANALTAEKQLSEARLALEKARTLLPSGREADQIRSQVEEKLRSLNNLSSLEK